MTRVAKRLDGAAFAADRERAELSQEGLARAIGVSIRSIAGWESGAIKSPGGGALLLAQDEMNERLDALGQPRVDPRSWWRDDVIEVAP